MANKFDRYTPTQSPTQIAEAQRKAVQAEKQAVAPRPLEKTPGSGQLTPNTYALPAVPRPSQLPQRTASATSGATGVANPPPVGNQAPQRVTTVQLGSAARNPYGFASGRGTTADAERWQQQNGGSISTRTITAREQAMAGKNPAERNYDALFMTPAEVAERDYNKRDQDNYRIEQQYGTKTRKADYSKAFSADPLAPNYSPTKAAMGQQREPAMVASGSGANQFPNFDAKPSELTEVDVRTGILTPHNAPGSAIPTAAKPFQYAAQPTQENQNWRQVLTNKHPNIGIAGSPENEAFVAAFKQHGDPNRAMETADQLFEQASAKKIAEAEGAGATEFASPSTEADAFAGDEASTAAAPVAGTPKVNVYSPVSDPANEAAWKRREAAMKAKADAETAAYNPSQPYSDTLKKGGNAVLDYVARHSNPYR